MVPSDSPLSAPPFAEPAAERSVVAACFLSADSLASAVAAGLTVRDFTVADNRHAFGSMVALRATGEAVDLGTMIDRGVDVVYLAESHMHVGSFATTVRLGEKLLAASARRALYLTLEAAAQRLGHVDVSATDVRVETLAKLVTVPTQDRTTEWTMPALTEIAWQRLSEPPQEQSTTQPISTGLRDLDVMLKGGWRPQNLVLVGGRPGMGKSVACAQFAMDAAKTMPVGFLALEMSAIDVMVRCIAGEAKVDANAIRSKTATPPEMAAVLQACSDLSERNMRIDDGGGRRIEDVCAIARTWHAAYGLRVLVVDYLGKIKMPRADRHDLAVGAVVSALKDLAKSLDIVVIAAVQLNRAADGNRPTIANLRDSGQLEQEADIVLFPWRADETAKYGPAEVIIGKQRGGGVGIVPVTWDGPGQRFRDAGDRGDYGRPADAPLPGGTRRQADPKAKATRGDRNWHGGD